MNQYDEYHNHTPVSLACSCNNIEILELLLKHGANPNMIQDPNDEKITTMHWAAYYENLSMMKLLIKYKFDYYHLINNTLAGGDHHSVFLQLCENGNIPCMEYILSVCSKNGFKYDRFWGFNSYCKAKTDIDITQRDINGYNSLHIAVENSNLSMIKYLLNKVYNHPRVRGILVNQTVLSTDIKTSHIASKKSNTKDGLQIFKLLTIKYNCSIDEITLKNAIISPSSLILDFMLNEQMYPNIDHITVTLIYQIFHHSPRLFIYKNITLIVKHVAKRYFNHDSISFYQYEQCIINILYSIIVRGTFNAFFEFSKEMICILLNTNDWKNFTTSELLDKESIECIQDNFNDNKKAVERKHADKLWLRLLNVMSNSFDNASLLNQYDDESKEQNKSREDNNRNQHDGEYYCNQNHLMTKATQSIRRYDSKPSSKCIFCDTVSGMMDYSCRQCQEYICNDCNVEISCIILNQMLELKRFAAFNQQIQSCNENDKMFKSVE